MKYCCKYPNKLTLKGYAQKKFTDYKDSGRYSDLLDAEMKNLLGDVLLDIHVTLSSSKEKLQQHMDFLLKMGSMSRNEFLAEIDEEAVSVYAVNGLFLAMHDPKGALDVIANNRKITFRSDKQSLCEMFLKEMTIDCIKEIVEANKAKITSKKVTFSDADVSKSEDRPASSRKATHEHVDGTTNYQYERHKSRDKVEKKEGNKDHKKSHGGAIVWVSRPLVTFSLKC